MGRRLLELAGAGLIALGGGLPIASAGASRAPPLTPGTGKHEGLFGQPGVEGVVGANGKAGAAGTAAFPDLDAP